MVGTPGSNIAAAYFKRQSRRNGEFALGQVLPAINLLVSQLSVRGAR
jgi:hypothetical protein